MSIIVHAHTRTRAHARYIHSFFLPFLPKEEKEIGDILVWAYSREKVHLARPQGFDGVSGMPRLRGACVDVCEKIGHGGLAANNLGFAAPDDAYAVMRAVRGLDGAAARVLEWHAVAGVEPDWVPYPVVGVRPGAAIYGLNARKRRAVVGCLVSFHGDLPEHLAVKRARYRMWAEGLAAAHAALEGRLSRFALSPRLPHPAPWEGA